MPTEQKPLTPEEELFRENPDEITEHDREPMNLSVRAGYMRGLANVAARSEDRLWLLRASRSLRAYAAVRFEADGMDPEAARRLVGEMKDGAK